MKLFVAVLLLAAIAVGVHAQKPEKPDAAVGCENCVHVHK